MSITYTGGTTGKPKGAIGGFGNVHDDADSTLRSENDRVPQILDVHPAVACWGRVLRADPDERRPDDGAAEVLSAEVLRTIDAKKITVAMPSMLYASMDPSQRGHARPVDARGRLTSSCVSGRRFKSHRLPWLRPIGPLLR